MTFKMSELVQTQDEELDLKLETLKSELFGFRNKKLDNKSQKTHLIRQTRKNIARVLTVKRERELRGRHG